MARTKPIEGWWFSDSSGKLPHGDGRAYAIGKKLSVKGELVICKNALHGSLDPFDALRYAPGEILHKVLFEGARKQESDKLGSRSRTIIASHDATDMLREFARDQPLSVVADWDMPPIVRHYVESDNPATENAAWRLAWREALSAAWSAARSARLHEAQSAALNAARADFNERVKKLFS